MLDYSLEVDQNLTEKMHQEIGEIPFSILKPIWASWPW
jgi:hypothetical protein